MSLTKVSTPAIKDEAITLAKLLHGDSNSNGKFLRANNGADPSFEDVAAAVGASGTLQYSDGSGNFAGNNIHKIVGDSLFTHDLYLGRDASNVDPIVQPAAQANITYKTTISASGAFGSILDGSGLQLGRNTQYVKLKALSDQTGQQSYDFAFPINAGSNGQALITDGSGNTSWSTISSDLVDDTSPQLGGDLDSNGHHIVITDGEELRLGNDHDTKIRFNGSKSQIVSSVQFDIDADIIDIHNAAQNATKARFLNNQVELYYANALRLDTTSGGADVRSSGSAVEMKLRTSGGTVRGWLYANDANQVGLLDEGGNWAIMHYNDNYTQFRIANAIKARIDGDGLKFGTDTAAANGLEDYEEGSFTPNIQDAASGGNSHGNSGVREGKYTKIGNTVTVMINCRSLSNSGLTGSHQLFITNLPFRMHGVERAVTWAQVQYFNNVSNTEFGMHFQINANQTIMRFFKMKDNQGANPAVTFNHWMYSNGYYGFSTTFTYITDQ